MRWRNTYLCVFALLFLSSCAALQIDIPNADLQPYAVQGRLGLQINQKVKFAEYETRYIKRSWDKSHSRATGFSTASGTAFIGRERKNNTLTFALTDPSGKQAEIFLSSSLKSEHLYVNKGENMEVNAKRYRKRDGRDNLCYAHIYLLDESSPWELSIDNAAVDMYQGGDIGEIGFNNELYYTIKLTHHTKPKTISKIPSGFLFEDKYGEIVAAVSLIDQGTVFLKQGNEKERLLLGTASLALLLNERFTD